MHLLATVFIKSGVVILDLARIDLTEQWHVLGVEHWRKELCMKRRMTEALLEPVAVVVAPFRVDLGVSNLIVCGSEVAELRDEDAIDVDLVCHDDEDRWNGRDPDECAESLLQADGENHQGLHEENAEKESIDYNVPQPLHDELVSAHAKRQRTYPSTLDSSYENEHKLILVHPRAEPEDDACCDGYKWRQRCKHEPNRGHEQLESNCEITLG